MSRLSTTFARLRSSGRVALMPFATAGDPDLLTTRRLVEAYAAAGADIVELGLPFSDPVADGPTIQRSTERALRAGTTTDEVLELVRQLSPTVPTVLLAYYNCIYRYGEERFAARAAACGLDGVIVPDLPPEEAASLRRHTQAHGIDLIHLVAPTSTDRRIRTIAASTSGFLYCVAVTGVTGARDRLAPELHSYLHRVRQLTDVPLAVGFGISGRDQAVAVAEVADGVIVASALIDRMHQAADVDTGIRNAVGLVRELREALDWVAAGHPGPVGSEVQ